MGKSNSKSGLFLLEMILVVLFFALSSAVYVRVFVAARQTEQRSKELTEATLAAQSFAEAFYATGGDLQALADESLVPYTSLSAELLTTDYDADWNPLQTSGDPQHAYRAELSVAASFTDTPSLTTGTVTILRKTDQSVILSMDLSCYPRTETGGLR